MIEYDGERLQKVLAALGWGSRRLCEELIADGRVTVNGEVAELGRRVDTLLDVVAVDGVPIGVRPDLVYYLLNKPRGVISTAHDPQGRPTVVDLVPQSPRVFPVGRLDGETEGLLLLTNDGELTHFLTHPSKGVEKEYLVLLRGNPRLNESQLKRLRQGVELDDGVTAPAKVSQRSDMTLSMTIHEGRNRQVRRMIEAIGHEVDRLVRTRIGPLVDTRLKPGTWRELSLAERRSLIEAMAEHDPR
ncbi:MAG: pseudouridine synthase RluB [Actinomycetota bacterium]|jgi:23S rRNA pseudouridine2605 synthase